MQKDQHTQNSWFTLSKHDFDLVLESKVEGLSGEVSDDVGQVPSPEREEALLFGDTDDTVDDALVLLVDCNLFAGMLYL